VTLAGRHRRTRGGGPITARRLWRAACRPVLALTATLTLATPVLAEDSASRFIDWMTERCTDPTQTLAQAEAAMSGWRIADATETDFISGFLADLEARAFHARGQMREVERGQLTADLRARSDAWLAETDPTRAQGRIYVHEENGFLALARMSNQSERVKVHGCYLLLRGPDQTLTDDLVDRFVVFPRQSDEAGFFWQARDVLEWQGQSRESRRSLAILMTDDNKREAAVLNFSNILTDTR